MKIRQFILLLAALLFACPAVRAERQDENRFLLIIDTSASMRGYSNEIVQAVADLMNSDMRGEFRKGDTLGLWTYSDHLNTDFPMQVWSRRDKDAILEGMIEYLQDKTFEKQARLDKVMPDLKRVVKASDRFTAILIFDGETRIHGTPFDKQINALEKRYSADLRAAHQPFMLMLASRRGTIFDYTINYPGSLALPHMARDEPPPATNAPVAATTPATNAPPAKPKPLRSLIMSAVKPAEVPTNPPAPAIVPAPPPVAAHPIAAASPTPSVNRGSPEPAPPAVQPEPVKQIQPVAAPAPAPAAVAPPVPQTPPSAPTPIVAQTTTPAVPTPSGGSQLALFIIAFSLLAIALALVVFLVKRSRASHEPSLISQSINRPR